ncbi:MAG: P63C domain-containing protein [Bacteroidetes bacterium]|nr:P63C domain-containing protein [Bacteroidota bacterium]
MKDEKLPKATHTGIIKIGEFEITAYNLDNGERVLSRIGFLRALGRTGKAKGGRKYDDEFQIPVFLSADNLKPFISSELIENSKPFRFLDLNGNEAIGYNAKLLPSTCYVFIDAQEANALKSNQTHIADRAKLLVRGFATIGIIALVDEATGYQYNREKDELQKILSAYISKELLPWQKRFPDEFYQEIFRLNGWDYTVNGIQNRPGVIGTWTKKLIYNLLPKGVLEELERITPKSDAGHKTKRLHQSLTLDIGEPHLEKQLISVITLMNISSDWNEFLKLFGKKFQKDLMELSVQPKFKKTTPKVSAKQYLMFEGQRDLFGDIIGQKKESEQSDEQEPLSEFNTKLQKALNYNPKD